MSGADLWLRPMRPDDVDAAERLTGRAYAEIDTRGPREAGAGPGRSAAQRRAWVRRTEQVLDSDPGGCWVAEVDGAQGRLAGVAVSAVREVMWVLSSFAVAREHRGRGVGAELLGAAAHHGRGCTRAGLNSSTSQSAVRRYHRAGFTLHPTMALSGVPDRSLLPAVDHVREGTSGDVELMDSIARRARGAPPGPDHAWLREHHRLLVLDRPAGSGFAYVGDQGPVLLAATRRRTAARLLAASLEHCAPGAPVRVGGITGANAWALDVGLGAGLELHHDGYLALRGLPPPPAYLPHSALL